MDDGQVCGRGNAQALSHDVEHAINSFPLSTDFLCNVNQAIFQNDDGLQVEQGGQATLQLADSSTHLSKTETPQREQYLHPGPDCLQTRQDRIHTLTHLTHASRFDSHETQAGRTTGAIHRVYAHLISHEFSGQQR